VYRARRVPGSIHVECVPVGSRIRLRAEVRWSANPDDFYRLQGALPLKQFNKLMRKLERHLTVPPTPHSMGGTELAVTFNFPLDHGTVTGSASAALEGPPPYDIVDLVCVFLDDLKRRSEFRITGLGVPFEDTLSEVEPASLVRRLAPWAILVFAVLTAMCTVTVLLLAMGGG
jgi:hypothetical protein